MGPVHSLRAAQKEEEGPYTGLYCSSHLPPTVDGCPPFLPTPSLLLPKEGEMSHISITPPFEIEIAEFNNRQRRSADQRGGSSVNLTPGHQDSWRAKGSRTGAVLGPYRVKNAPQSCLPRSARHCLLSIWRRKRMEGGKG